MRIWQRKPAPPLGEFVQALWVFEGDPQPHPKERALPDGCALLIVNLHEDRTRLYDRHDFCLTRSFNGCALIAPQTEYNIIDSELRSIAGIHFKPGGLYPFMASPVDELQGERLPLDDLWGRFAGELRERLLEARGPEERLDVLEQAMLARARRPLVRHAAVRFALHEFAQGPCTQTVADVTDQTGLSARRFIEVFRRETGLTPKLFCRLQRFQQVLQVLAAGKPVEWADVALEAGYFDQAHFIHDFRAFSGINPSTYSAARPRFPNHVALEA